MRCGLILSTAAFLLAASVEAAPAARAGAATVQQAHYHADPAHPWRRHGYARNWREPGVWRYQRSFRSNARDFYGSPEFQGR